MGLPEENMERMQTLEDAWNAQDVDGVARFHKPDVVVYWPGQPLMPVSWTDLDRST
jgi:ketosteroid isomerase-like protein